jgi:hypothetical protein
MRCRNCIVVACWMSATAWKTRCAQTNSSPREHVLVDRVDDRREVREQDAAEDLVLLEHLVGVEALRVTQRTELHRLGHHRRVGVHRVCRILDVVGDAGEEERHVIEQLVGREDPVGVDGHALLDPLEPAPVNSAEAPRMRLASVTARGQGAWSVRSGTGGAGATCAPAVGARRPR